ncbi:MAG: RNA methyltransferase [Actinomycetia bacterium]|nr:RNA methyltransferase [Actinomycetes bacterium]
MSWSQQTADEPIGTASAGVLRSARRLLTRKGRQTSGQFLVEGPQAVREAAAAGLVRRCLVTAAAQPRLSPLLARVRESGAELLQVGEADLDRLVGTVHPQGVVAVCTVRETSLAQLLDRPTQLVVVCAQVRDPGNAGAVIRCADAFGADGVVLTEQSVEPYNPKTVRATVGSLFHLPVVHGPALAETVAALRAAGMWVLAADGSGEVTLTELERDGSLSRPVAWVFGNEAWGLPAADRELVDQVVRIPMWGHAESLNLSTAAAVCLYATAAAQRPVSPPQNPVPATQSLS